MNSPAAAAAGQGRLGPHRVPRLLGGVGLTFVVSAATAGCIVPVPHPESPVAGSRRAITEQETQFIRNGATSREEVLLRLGEPDLRWDGDRVMAYGWTTSNLGVLVAAGNGTSGGAGWWDSPINRFLLCEFDGGGRVRRHEISTAPPFQNGPQHAEQLRQAW